MVVQLKECCCGCSLKTGTIIVGALGIFTGLFMVTTALVKPKVLDDDHLDLINKLDGLSQSGDVHDRNFGVIMKVIMALVEIIMSTVLIVGAVKGRAKLVHSWIVLNVVQNALAIIVIVSLGCYQLVIGHVEQAVVLLVALILAESIQVYMILVVNSFHTTIISPPTYEYTMTKEPIMNA